MTCVVASQVLFACAEALHAHGYSNEACRLAVELAGDLLANPPDLKVEQPQTKVNLLLPGSTLNRLPSLSCRPITSLTAKSEMYHLPVPLTSCPTRYF